MSDLISRQAAIDAIMAQSGVVDKSVAKRVLWQLSSAQQSMTATSNTATSNTVKIPVLDGTTERLPSIDAVPVVRCEDCKCKDKYENFCRRFLREIEPSDYCSYAEGKEE